MNEVRLRKTLEFADILSILKEKDYFTTVDGDEEMIDEFPPEQFELMKIPAIKYLLHVYLDTEKVADEALRNINLMHEIINMEI